MSDLTNREGLVAEALRLLDLANAMPVPVSAGGEGYGFEGIEVLRGLPGGLEHVFYPSQDGPGAGAGAVVEVTVRVMVGPDRSTVVVRRGGEPVVLHEVRPQGAETDGIGAVVEAAVREGIAISRLQAFEGVDVVARHARLQRELLLPFIGSEAVDEESPRPPCLRTAVGLDGSVRDVHDAVVWPHRLTPGPCRHDYSLVPSLVRSAEPNERRDLPVIPARVPHRPCLPRPGEQPRTRLRG